MRAGFLGLAIAAPAALIAIAACTAGSIEQVAEGGVDASNPDMDALVAADGAPLARSQAIFNAKLVAGAMNPAACKSAGMTVTLGAFEPPNPIAGGTMQGGGTVSVFCQVKMFAQGFLLDANLTVPGSPASDVTLDATLDLKGASSAGKLAVTFSGSQFSSDTCVLDPDVRPGQSAAAPGRDWVGIKCVGAQNTATQQICDIEGELRVENCGQ